MSFYVIAASSREALQAHQQTGTANDNMTNKRTATPSSAVAVATNNVNSVSSRRVDESKDFSVAVRDRLCRQVKDKSVFLPGLKVSGLEVRGCRGLEVRGC